MYRIGQEVTLNGNKHVYLGDAAGVFTFRKLEDGSITELLPGQTELPEDPIPDPVPPPTTGTRKRVLTE